MEIKITESAVELLKQKLSEENEKAGVRIYIAGIG